MRVKKGKQVSITLRHPGRNRLATLLLILSVVGVLTSITLISVGVVIHTAVKPFAAILDTYDGLYLPIILTALGVAGIAVHSLLTFLLLDFTKEERADYFGKVCLAVLSCAALTMVAGIICFAHIREVRSSFKAGIFNGMKNYQNNTEMKSAVDEVQIRYQCCGVKGYEDWFTLEWINETYVADKEKLKKKRTNGAYKSDDVPFSCCDPGAFRPCIHDAVHTNSHHFNYDHTKNVTIYKTGCLVSIKNYFGPGLLFIMGIVICSIAVMEAALGGGLRILYTSLESATMTGDEFGPGTGILLPGQVQEYDDPRAADKTNNK
ncbi:putative Peripherin-2 [Hypsibius exemplaris]|uniref:Peripherin-2 n=1 Tax=Hypsibius exemplaris TaxID=2072580 RepID=A0A1W0XD68_HYPEX|nr:putative Peripherin-2 [Hypsibius exemplaris]